MWSLWLRRQQVSDGLRLCLYNPFGLQVGHDTWRDSARLELIGD
ncbi:hypothetical protein NP493_1516g00014 [Ridgeia piscesae]|uniref:Uncharacterized protein n=1 Tax=Ridgeia piscesae TaxID=27915 RepID=A0AAD9K0D2_RIDPI|nr:hypothetical protein NP493_1516g00014 [Ridgeia piscesae]